MRAAIHHPTDSKTMFCLLSGEELNKYYFMILVPLGVAENILSFAVS